MRNFRNLTIWSKSYELTLEIYRVSKTFPKDEIYGLTSQLRRSCSSIPANIAEGSGKNTNSDFIRFLNISMGSACETENHLQLSRDLGYLENILYENLNFRIVEIKKMIIGYTSSLQMKK